MVVNGVDLDRKLRSAKAHVKGQRGGARERQALHAYAELAALRARYQTIVHARFDLDVTRQTSLAVALVYVKLIQGRAKRRLWAQIHEAKRVRVEFPEVSG
jgi:hypothetical protein